MGLLSKLKSLLGAGDGDRSAGSGVDVTVERDPSADAEQAGEQTTTADEAADTDAGTATESPEADHPADPSEADEEPAVEEAEPESETETEPDAAVEEAEPETEPEVEDTEPETEADEEEVEAEEDESEADAEDAEPAAESGDGEPVTVLDGIGPAYGERLEDAGVSTVAELAAADPEELANKVDLSAKRVGRWVDSANDRT